MEPNFYSQNHLLLGKTLLRQNKKDEAKKWLEKAAYSNPCKTVDDESVSTIQCDCTILQCAIQKLHGEWVQAFGAVISGIIWVDKR